MALRRDDRSTLRIAAILRRHEDFHGFAACRGEWSRALKIEPMSYRK
jgi:hypothetical protein